MSTIVGNWDGQQTNYLNWISYMPHGGVRAMQMGNNLWRAFGYTAQLQIAHYIDVVNNDIGQTLLDETLYWGTTNNNGNLNSVITSHGVPGSPGTLKFHDYYWYDALNRVMAANGKDASENLLWAQNFSYDRYGNQWMPSSGGLSGSGLTPTTNVYNSANQMGATSYDSAGNQIQFGANTLVYDAENHVVQANEAPSAGGATRRSMSTMATAVA